MKSFFKVLIISFFFLFGILTFGLIALYFLYSYYKKNKDSVHSFIAKAERFASTLDRSFKSAVEELPVDTIEKEVKKTYVGRRAVQAVENLIKDIDVSSSKIKLNQRQEKLLDLFSTNKNLSMSQIQKNFPEVNVRTVRRDLAKLEEGSLIEQSGRTKNSSYRLRI